MNKNEMKRHLVERGFWIHNKMMSTGTTTPVIMWDGIEAGYLFDDVVQLYDDTEYKNSRLTEIKYTNPRCLERVDRIILYLKTADRRRERRMRRERAQKVKLYFEGQKNKIREIDRQVEILKAEYYRRQKEASCA